MILAFLRPFGLEGGWGEEVLFRCLAKGGTKRTCNTLVGPLLAQRRHPASEEPGRCRARRSVAIVAGTARIGRWLWRNGTEAAKNEAAQAQGPGAWSGCTSPPTIPTSVGGRVRTTCNRTEIVVIGLVAEVVSVKKPDSLIYHVVYRHQQVACRPPPPRRSARTVAGAVDVPAPPPGGAGAGRPGAGAAGLRGLAAPRRDDARLRLGPLARRPAAVLAALVGFAVWWTM